MPGPVEQALDSVTDEASFLRFVSVLAGDFAADRSESGRAVNSPFGPGPRGWENGCVDTFLEAAVSWAEDSGSRQPAAQNPWRRCAEILRAGKSYE